MLPGGIAYGDELVHFIVEWPGPMLGLAVLFAIGALSVYGWRRRAVGR